MKSVFVLVIILTGAFKVHAQQEKDDYKKMIDSAITIKYAAYAEVAAKEKYRYYLENLYLLNEKDQPLNDVSLSDKFKFFDIYDSQSRKVLSKGVYAWKVIAKLNGNQCIISIIDFFITYKDRNYNFANGGGSQTIFEYSCDEGKWKLVNTESYAI